MTRRRFGVALAATLAMVAGLAVAPAGAHHKLDATVVNTPNCSAN